MKDFQIQSDEIHYLNFKEELLYHCGNIDKIDKINVFCKKCIKNKKQYTSPSQSTTTTTTTTLRTTARTTAAAATVIEKMVIENVEKNKTNVENDCEHCFKKKYEIGVEKETTSLILEKTILHIAKKTKRYPLSPSDGVMEAKHWFSETGRLIAFVEQIDPIYLNLFVCLLYFGANKKLIWNVINALKYVIFEKHSENPIFDSEFYDTLNKKNYEKVEAANKTAPENMKRYNFVLLNPKSKLGDKKNTPKEMKRRLDTLKKIGGPRNMLGNKYNNFRCIFYSIEEVLDIAKISQNDFFEIIHRISQQKHIFDLFDTYDNVDSSVFKMGKRFV